MQHDKHTYYFEKYLRKEMSRNEKEAFELKLSDDVEFKADFDKYAINHDEIVKEELEEYNEEIIPNKPKNYSWVWVLFSVFGLVLIIDYYANQKYNEEQKLNQTYKEALVSRLKSVFVEPFKKIGNKDTANSSNIYKVQSTIRAYQNEVDEKDSINVGSIDSSLIEEKISNQFQQLLIDKHIESNVKDVFLNDSLMFVIELEKFKEKFKLITSSTDSILSDSLVTKLTLQSLTKSTNISKHLFVEFWESSIGFQGYQFNGKKLVIYGVVKPFDVFILKQGNNTFILHSKWGETALEIDNQLHKFEN